MLHWFQGEDLMPNLTVWIQFGNIIATDRTMAAQALSA